ncbi:MAG TPA: lipopolysaccharide heptosyltransferase II [Chloroflexota bacterium]|nr:lipopolysaccharide heptosyltransferase II [Chloroflexota bacterium]
MSLIRLRYSAKRALRGLLLALLFVAFTLLGLVSAAGRLLCRVSPPDPEQVRRILLIRLDLLGDLVMSLPAVSALKDTYRHAEVTVLALPYAADLLELAPEVDHVLTYDVNRIRVPRQVLRPRNYREFFRLVGQLRRTKFDLCLSLHGRFACVMAWLSGCPRRYGYAAEAYPFTLTRTLPGGRYAVRQHETVYNLHLAELAGAHVDAPNPPAPKLTIPQAEQRRMRHLLAEFEVRGDSLLVVVHPGASNGSAKRWLPECWGKVASRLHKELGAAVVLTGTPAEAEVVQAVVRACAFKPLVMAGQTSIPQLGALLKRANLLLSSDSGPAHVAAALGTPQVTIFGPTDPLVYAPCNPKALVLRRELACSPCYDARATAECRFGHVNCMRQLTPDEVYEAAVGLLQKRLQQVQP